MERFCTACAKNDCQTWTKSFLNKVSENSPQGSTNLYQSLQAKRFARTRSGLFNSIDEVLKRAGIPMMKVHLWYKRYIIRLILGLLPTEIQFTPNMIWFYVSQPIFGLHLIQLRLFTCCWHNPNVSYIIKILCVKDYEFTFPIFTFAEKLINKTLNSPFSHH